MKVDKKLVRILVPFAPVVMIFAAIVLLGTVFLRAYDTGRPIPRAPGNGLFLAAPSINPTEDSPTIATHMNTNTPGSFSPVDATSDAPVATTRLREVPSPVVPNIPHTVTNLLDTVTTTLDETTDSVADNVVDPTLEVVDDVILSVLPPPSTD